MGELIYFNRAATQNLDAHVAKRIRLRRKLLGMSPEMLAASTEISTKEIEQIEQGNKKITPLLLLDLSDALQVPIWWFFAKLDN